MARTVADSITSQAAVLNEYVATLLEEALKESGLGLSGFQLLSAVKASPTATQAEIAVNLGITPSSLCEAIRAASDKGFVEQEASASDRRAKRVVLTRKGAIILEAALKTLEEAEELATRGISEGRLATAVEVLRQASANLSKAS